MFETAEEAALHYAKYIGAERSAAEAEADIRESHLQQTRQKIKRRRRDSHWCHHHNLRLASRVSIVNMGGLWQKSTKMAKSVILVSSWHV